ncbi:MAG: glycosyltransferase family 4 protein [Candidatus Odinarchaeota archaeon]
MLIVQICQNFFTHGGVMKRSRQESLALLKAGHRVIVLTDVIYMSHLYQFKKYNKKLHIIPIKPIFLYGLRNLSSQLTFTLKTFFSLRKITEKEKIDLIVCHGSVPSYAVAPFGKKKHIPTALVIQDVIRDRIVTGNPYNWLETRIFLHSNLFAFRNMYYVIVVSKYNRMLVLRDGASPERTFIKYNAVNTELFKPINGISKDIDILFIGRLSIEKGIDILIDSIKLLIQKRRILIIGRGPLKKELQAYARQVRQHEIIFEGFVNHDSLPHYINRSKIVVTPSRSESQASVPLESMSCGVPVIASRASGMEDSIDHKKSGWLLRENKPDILAQQIEEVIDNESLLSEIGLSALKKSEFFSQKKFFNEIIGFLEMLINNYKNDL